MAETISQHQTGAFSVPVDGQPNAAADVLTNDNALRTANNAHDADGGVHVQSSVLASRPAAGTAGRKWFSTDDRNLWYDTGSAWVAMLASMPSCRLTGSADVEIPNGTLTALTWNTETHDTGGMHSTVSNTGRITIPSGEGGIYAFTACVQWEPAAGGARTLYLMKNGSPNSVAITQSVTSAGVPSLPQSISTIIQLIAGDYIEVFVAQDTGAGIDLLFTTAGTHFAAARII